MLSSEEYLKSFKESYKKSLRQANRSLQFAVAFGITGLLFFFAVFYAVSFTLEKESFTTLSNELVNTSENISSAIVKVEDQNNQNKNERLILLKNLKNDLNRLSLKVEREIIDLNKNFIIVSLVGGSLIELIAVINFYQYGKAFSQISKRLDRNQMFFLANSICEDLKDEEDKRIARIELIKKVIPDAQQSVLHNEKFPNSPNNIEQDSNTNDSNSPQENLAEGKSKNGNN